MELMVVRTTVSFIEQGIPDRIHSARDTLARVNVQLAVEIVRMNVGFVAGAIGVA